MLNMGFETKINKVVNETVDDANPHWVWGTLFVDVNEAQALVLKSVLENEVADDVTIDINLLKATTTEPWDQWAFDFI